MVKIKSILNIIIFTDQRILGINWQLPAFTSLQLERGRQVLSAITEVPGTNPEVLPQAQ
jgi:hypothetical protein